MTPETNPIAPATPPARDRTPPALPDSGVRTMRMDLERMLAPKQPQPGFTRTPPEPETAVAKKIAERIEEQIAHHKRRAHKNLLVISAAALLIAFIGGAALWLEPLSLLSRNGDNAPPPVAPPPPPEIPPPPPLFPTETSLTIRVGLLDRTGFHQKLAEVAAEEEREGTIKRWVVKIHEETKERLATLQDIFQIALIAPPANFLARIDSPAMLFIYYGPAGQRGKLGIVVKTKSPDRTFRDLLSWEQSLFADFRELFLATATTTPSGAFEDRTYRNIDWRYLRLAETQDNGIAYGVFPAESLLIMTGSKKAFETVINRLLIQ